MFTIPLHRSLQPAVHLTALQTPTSRLVRQVTYLAHRQPSSAAAMSTKRNIEATSTHEPASSSPASTSQEGRASKRQAVLHVEQGNQGRRSESEARGTSEGEDAVELDEEAMIAAAVEAEQQDAKANATASPSAKSDSTVGGEGAPSADRGLSLVSGKDPLEVERRTMHAEWFKRLEREMRTPSFEKLKAFLAAEARSGKVIYPPPQLIHSWSRLTPPSMVKVVIIGWLAFCSSLAAQANAFTLLAYHGPGQACGMSFSVPKGVPVPPSLKNIYKELRAQYGAQFAVPTHGCLEGWAKQGVLLLNACLTVRAHAAASHHGQGWEAFTRQVIRSIAADAARSIGKSPDAKVPSSSSVSAASLSSPNTPGKGNSTITSFFGKPKAKGPTTPATPTSSDAAGRATSREVPETGSGVVFLAWGAPAAKTLAEAGVSSNSPNVLVLKSAHPSPLSAHKGFFRAAATPRVGDSLFEEANRWLTAPARRGSGGGIEWAKL